MRDTLAALLPVLTFLASTAGSGLLASRLFDWLCTQLPAEDAPLLRPLLRRILPLLHAPRYKRIAALALAGLISLAASMALAAATGGDVALTLDKSLAAALSAIIGQLMHGMRLSNEIDA